MNSGPALTVAVLTKHLLRTPTGSAGPSSLPPHGQQVHHRDRGLLLRDRAARDHRNGRGPGVTTIPPPPQAVQWANASAYHLLVSLVNLLNLPLPKGTFIPRRAATLTVLDRDVERLRMLKRELDPDDPAAVRGYLVAAKAVLLELTWALHQWRDLKRNPEFDADLERLGTVVAQMRDLGDAEGVRDLAYKLAIMLPFFEDEERMRERNAIAKRWFEEREGS